MPLPHPPAPGEYRCRRRSWRASRFSARPTYKGLPLTTFKCISVTAFVASSGDAKHTKPNPLQRPLSSFMDMQDVMLPKGSKSDLNEESSVLSSKFFMYKLTPCARVGE